MGDRALFCLAGEMPAAFEELLAQAPYRCVVRRAGFPDIMVTKTLNAFREAGCSSRVFW